LISERQRLVTDAEVLQEILHGYVAINRRHAIQPAFDALLTIVDEVFTVELATITREKHSSRMCTLVRPRCHSSCGDAAKRNPPDTDL